MKCEQLHSFVVMGSGLWQAPELPLERRQARSGDTASVLLQEINLLSLPCCRGLL